ncbi:hypothetical protein QBC43DRAFT_312372 [Cladorrhinum sp. PSN259]|nr:hypothetical protein QBC43DRAFT_312372 [Cladorrhinum sp. PSN259]
MASKQLADTQDHPAAPAAPAQQQQQPSKVDLVNPSLPRQFRRPLRILDPLPTPFLDKQQLPLIPVSSSSSSSSSSSHSRNKKNVVTLIVPTSNAAKTLLLESYLKSQLPLGSGGYTLRTVRIPAASNAGEQPYDDMGVKGACNRVRNALGDFTGKGQDEGEGKGEREEVGTVIVGAVENFVLRNVSLSTKDGNAGERDDGGRVCDEGEKVQAADYGVLMLYNATSGELRCGISKGVEVPLEYLREAEGYGFEEDDDAEEKEDEDGEGKRTIKMKGKVTVGEVLAANIEGLDKADWHKVLSEGGVSRYELLKEGLEGLGFPLDL